MNDGTNMTLNPWRSIWLQPRATIRQIVTTDPDRHVLALIAANSVIGAVLAGVTSALQGQFGLLFLLLLVLVVAPIFAVIMLYLVALLLRWTGRWLGGVASSRDLRAALAWGCVPSLLAGAALLVALLVPGLDLFPTPPPELQSEPFALATYGLGSKIQLLAGVWSLFTMIKCIAEVQGFSAWRALGNYLLAILMMIVAIVAIAAGAGVLVALLAK